MKVTFEAYVALLVFFTVTGGVSIFVAIFFLSFFSGATLLISFLVSFTLSLLSVFVIFITLYFYPSLQVGNRKRILDEELPYVASHMAVLSRASLPPERIFKSMAQIDAMRIKSVAAEESISVIRDVNFLGYDILSSMERRVKVSPSIKFVDFLDGFISVTRSGGDLTDYFLSSAKGLMDQARIAARQLIETLGGIAEAYIALMVVFPLLIIIMMSVMGMIGGGVGGFSTIFIMQIVTYLIIPAIVVILLLILDSIMPPR
jgi:flagellar protein FlaJ